MHQLEFFKFLVEQNNPYPGAPNSAIFRGVAEGQPRFDKGGGGCNNFLRVKNITFRVFTLSD